MRAVRCVETGHPAGVVDLAEPRPGPGQVLLKVAGAGVCHSDLHILDEDLGRKGPFTLGRENAGWIAGRGAGVEGGKEGDPCRTGARARN